MIYPLGGLFFGALLGAYRAKSKGGKVADIAQWAAVFAMIFGVIGMFIAIIITRSTV
ncbi:hypothetical protein Q4555_12650 [Octadecabacter sp. 1_MG-2023]|uniref:hypothetical protein n=1 Tax=unclassified Octadecabacter TaxID=196158 RepID=UPI001C085D32|nr:MULTISPECIES: hypothetical protein [unclassified Octadecabacter]MBU2993634.1 hypothetical protein [Octadecabacter sp. B2R22]MDO6735522.1 hypothetical protein [Octadecabacter sp. 1_MG-2023]